MKKKAHPDLKKFLQMIPEAPEAECVKFAHSRPDLSAEPGALMQAALHGRAKVAGKLLEQGADPNGTVPSHERYRPLHRAIEHRGFPKNPGHVPTVKLLLEAGADMEIRATWMGITALATAGMVGDEEMISLLMTHDPVQSLFSAAVLADAPQVTKLLKKKGAASASDENNMTALHYVCLSGLREPRHQESLRRIAHLLCDAGADLNFAPQIGPYPKTPALHFVAWGNNLAVAQVLLERGADPNLGFGNCLWRSQEELAELFVKHGADVNGVACEKTGQRLLHSRIHWNLTTVVTWLLDHGADPNLRDNLGNTALHFAVKRGASAKIVEALLKHGAEPKLKNNEGQTAADITKLKKGA